jgi:hypothetical protein
MLEISAFLLIPGPTLLPKLLPLNLLERVTTKRLTKSKIIEIVAALDLSYVALYVVKINLVKVNLKKNATTFDHGLSFKERQKKHIYRVQRYYRNRQKRLKADKQYRSKFRIPRTKKKIYYYIN